MRSVLGRITAGAAWRILVSANSRDKSLAEGCVDCNKDEREQSEHDKGAEVSQWTSSALLVREKRMREVRETTKNWKRVKVAHPAWSLHQLRRSRKK